MDSAAFILAVDNICKEKNISQDVVFEGMELALTTAYKKNFNSQTNVRVDIDRVSGEIRVFSILKVVDTLEEDYDDDEDDEFFDDETEEGEVIELEEKEKEKKIIEEKILLEDAIKIDTVGQDQYANIPTKGTFDTIINDLDCGWKPLEVKKTLKRLKLLRITAGRPYDYADYDDEGEQYRAISLRLKKKETTENADQDV